MVTYNHDLQVVGTFSSANMAHGSVEITPVANSPTSVTVTGLSLQGTGAVLVQTTPLTDAPGSEVVETSYNNPTPTGANIFIYRTNTTATFVYWFMWRIP